MTSYGGASEAAENLICGYFRSRELADGTADFCRRHGMNVIVTGREAKHLVLALTGGRVGEEAAMVRITPVRMSLEERRVSRHCRVAGCLVAQAARNAAIPRALQVEADEELVWAFGIPEEALRMEGETHESNSIDPGDAPVDCLLGR